MVKFVKVVLSVATRWSLCTPRYEVFDVTGRLMYKIEGICCYIKCCADVPFKVTLAAMLFVFIPWSVVTITV